MHYLSRYDIEQIQIGMCSKQWNFSLPISEGLMIINLSDQPQLDILYLVDFFSKTSIR